MLSSLACLLFLFCIRFDGTCYGVFVPYARKPCVPFNRSENDQPERRLIKLDNFLADGSATAYVYEKNAEHLAEHQITRRVDHEIRLPSNFTLKQVTDGMRMRYGWRNTQIRWDNNDDRLLNRPRKLHAIKKSSFAFPLRIEIKNLNDRADWKPIQVKLDGYEYRCDINSTFHDLVEEMQLEEYNENDWSGIFSFKDEEQDDPIRPFTLEMNDKLYDEEMHRHLQHRNVVATENDILVVEISNLKAEIYVRQQNPTKINNLYKQADLPAVILTVELLGGQMSVEELIPMINERFGWQNFSHYRTVLQKDGGAHSRSIQSFGRIPNGQTQKFYARRVDVHARKDVEAMRIIGEDAVYDIFLYFRRIIIILLPSMYLFE